MAVKGNQFKSNSFKEETAPQQPKTKTEKGVGFFEKLASFSPTEFANSRYVKILGLTFLLLSIYFFISFTSYLFTWQEDQSYVSTLNGGWGNLFKTNKELRENGLKSPIVENWLGKFGALLSNQFIYEWFGIASFIFIFILFIVGYRLLFKIRLISISKTFGYSFFAIIFCSITFGFFHGLVKDTPNFLEGEFGYWTNQLLNAEIGKAGTGFILLFALLTMLVVAYNIDFKIPTKKQIVEPINNAFEDDGLTEEMEDEEEDIDEEVELSLIVTESPLEETLKPINKPLHINDKPLEQNPIFHEPVVLSPDPKSDDYDNKEDNTLPLTIGLTRPMGELSIEQADEEKAKSLLEQFGTYDHTLELASYKYPTLDLLENYGSNKINVNADELEANKNKIVETLNHYNIEIDKIKATIGPTVTLYEIIPAPGVRISKIKNLEDDIALSLAALGIRIIAPMPGKGTIGIEVPNQHPEMVSMRSVLATEKYQNTTMDLPIALGKTISNEVFIADLAKMPHLLVAGATGQGKSVGINAILVSLLFKKHPSELKFVLVDPKKVELTLFRKIERHFLAKLPDEADAIITDTKKVVNTLNSLCIEMDERYDLLKDAQVRNIKEYNQKFTSRKISDPEKHRYLPYIVLVIDEFADLMMTAGKEVEVPIARIAQLARAVGIHLVIATQRPSVNIITGTIKANFPSRLAFRVLSKIDSRTILDTGGADQLIGRGDMLLSTGSDLIRLQCAFVDTPEVERISDFIGNQRGYPSAMYLPEYVGEGEAASTKEYDPDNRDPMFEEAARLIVLHQQGSTSLIQRKMKLGYNRAGRIIDQLEAAGIVGPFEGSKARDVLYPDEYSLERYLETLQK
jgi:S-DNA-T family DNA segregation ATPase FtsK/SpoIIIE